ncbi:MAG: hypothetical protein IPL32_10985 [Chloracidobacterium sp.]|nr:hypothetical protein [Chloracidobacterium sp.]
MKLRWRFGIVAGLFLAVFSLYPQLKLVYNRGGDWNGHYAYNDIDEVAYASYLKALIDGRPRKNDPYTGRDDSPETPQQESLFSIQFVAPYSIAIPARILGIGTPWAITIAGALAAFLTALAIFWLIGMITGDSLYAMAGSLVVLCGGALFAGEGAIGEILGTSYSYPYFPGFRRYVPAMAFPAFFVLVALVWKIFAHERHESRELGHRSKISTSHVLLVLFSALCFGYTVFSYFYVWTTAVAWLTCLGLCWLVVRPAGFARDIKLLAGLAFGCIVFLAPYAYLLVNRSRSMDEVQILVQTRMPDLLRVPELISFGVLAVIAVGILLRILALKDRSTLFAISLALTQVAVFNQQVITGQELQPIHYQVFIGNYVAGLAVVVTFGLIWSNFDKRDSTFPKFVFASVAVIAAAWGFVECHYTVRILDDVNVARDEALPVARRLTEIGKEDPDRHTKVVLHLGMAEADDLPTVAPQSVLWARHQHVFSGLTSWQENKERYYQLLYYQGINGHQIGQAMKRGEDFVSMIALFGWGRHTDRLNSAYKPLTFGEIDEEMRVFDEYCQNFDGSRPDVVRLDYLVAPSEPQPIFDNIDKWYSRDEGETFGKYVFYRLKLR